MHVHIHKTPLPGFAGVEVVKADDLGLAALVRKAVQHLLHIDQDFGLQRLVHQALRRAPDQAPTFLQYVQGHSDRHHRIQPQPT